jgi:hypothetical protein
MHRRIMIIAVIVTLLTALGFISQVTPAGYTRIDLKEAGEGRRLLAAVLTDGERVVLTWRNSQFGLDVTEAFFAKSGLLIQDQVTFAVPGGPPPPRVPARDVADLFHTGGPFDARGLCRPFSRIVYRISEIGHPKLRVKDRTVSLKEEAGFGGRVILSTARATLSEIILGR